MFQLDRILLIVIVHVWISKLLQFVTRKLQPDKISCHLSFANWSACIRRNISFNVSSSWAIIFRFNSKTHWQMFLLLYGRHFCVPPKESDYDIKVSRKVGRVLTSDEVHFVSLADNLTVQFSNLLKLPLEWKTKQLNGPGNYPELRETGPRFATPLWCLLLLLLLFFPLSNVPKLPVFTQYQYKN